MFRILFFLFIELVFLSSIWGAEIVGVVSDNTTGELLVGTTIYIKELKIGTSSGLDGSYIFKNLPSGNYTLFCTYISYSSDEKQVSLSSSVPRIKADFSLKPAILELSQVTVLGYTDKSTENNARSSEKNATSIINIVSAKAIELSPDLNVASVVQRMSGVTLERNNSGEAQYAVLRGMDKRYNYTLVNGVKIPSPDNKHRFVPLDIFPGELLDRLEVTKSLTADMEGDATGGVINMVMKDAAANFTLQANIAMGYNSRFLDNPLLYFPKENVIIKSPREVNGKDYSATMDFFNNNSGLLLKQNFCPNYTAGFALGNRFFDKKFGFIVAANIQNNYKGSSSILIDDEMIQTEQTVRVTEHNYRTYYENQRQYGIHTKTDFQFNDRNKLELYNAYINAENSQVRQNNSTNFKLNYDPANGNLDMALQTRIRYTMQEIWVSDLQGKHNLFNDINFQWSAVFSIANNRIPENTQINIDLLQQNFVDNIYADADGSTRRWEHNSDKNYSGYINFEKKYQWNTNIIAVKTGGLYRNKLRTNSYVNYRFKPLNGDQRYGVHYNSFEEITWTLSTPFGSVGPLEYNAHENIAAGYLMLQFQRIKFNFIAGLRSEYTNQGYYMYFPNAGEKPDGKQNYNDLLPSFQLKYSPQSSVNWRASYFKSLNRPGFFEIVPYQIVNEDYDEYGNKNLKRAIIDNFDFRWEYFPKATEQVMAGFFYKKIKDPIEFAYYSVNQRQSGYTPANLGIADNYGLEIDVIKYLRNIGVKANYTFILSSITTPKILYAYDETNTLKKNTPNQTRPLSGQAAHVANTSLLYKHTRWGFDAQLSAAYTGEKIVVVSQYLNSDYWQ
jgi:outer membrane receptor protein involved in Fe transport